MQDTIVQTQAAIDIDATDGKIRLDKQIKTVLANKPILAKILLHTMKEFEGYDLQSVIDCIDGEPLISTVSVMPGLTNIQLPKVKELATEDSVPGEGVIYYDIRVAVKIPGGNGHPEPIKILINIEAQKSYYPGYDIPTRGIFYAARMLSSQLSTEFTVATEDKVKYDNIKKVYSIWICMDTSKESENTIDQYYIEREHLVGLNKKTARYDLMSVIIICLSKNSDITKTDNELIQMLLTLLDAKLDKRTKKERLQKDFGIPMTIKLSEEVDDMCNLSGYYEKQGIEQGIAQGIAQTTSKIIENMLKLGKEIGEIALCCGVEEDVVEKIKNEKMYNV